MSNFVVSTPVQTSFPGAFRIDFVTGATPTAPETAYRNRVHVFLDEIDRQHRTDTDPATAEDKGASSSERAVLEARLQLRTDMAMWLRNSAAAVQAGKLDAVAALDDAELARATWVAELKCLSRKLFFVRVIYGDKIPDSDRSYAIGLELVVRDGLRAPQDKPSDDQQALFIDLYGALTVVTAVCRDMDVKPGSLAFRLTSAADRAKQTQRSARTLDDYVRKLQGISELGLSQSQTALAKVALVNLEQEVLAHEARRIKNGYVGALGRRTLGVVAGLLVPYVLIVFGKMPLLPAPAETFGLAWWKDHSSFLLAGMGAAVGTWLSFSIRNVKLTFEQLGSVEADLLNPTLRLFFVLGLTLAAYLLFWTGVLGISVGGLKVDAETLKTVGSIAFLVGLLCGLSERALATAISGRSAAFVGGLETGGAAKASPAAKG